MIKITINKAKYSRKLSAFLKISSQKFILKSKFWFYETKIIKFNFSQYHKKYMICPECQTKLQIDKNPNGILWQCNHCSGVAANLAILRKQLNPDIVQSFWRRSQSSRISSRKCPSCQRPLKNFTSFINNRSINLDLCKQCQIVWFDEGELAPFSKNFAHEDKLSPEVRRELAICKLQYQKDCKEQIEKDVSEISRWIYILTAILRLLVWISLDV